MKNFINIASTEEEQVENIKKWIKENYIAIITIVILGFGSIFVVNYYKEYKENNNNKARELYLAVNKNNNTNINKLNTHNAYMNFTKLLLAKNNVDFDNNKAIAILKTVDNDNKIIKDVANIRLSKLYLSNKNYDQALKILNNNVISDITNSIKGDIYLAQNKIKQAKKYYNLSYTNSKNRAFKTLISIKLNDIN